MPVSGERSAEVDERGFVFIGDDGRPYWCALHCGEPWLFWWHPDRHWVTLHPVTKMYVWALPRTLTDHEEDVYHAAARRNGYGAPEPRGGE